jgi:dienelactone hydrolase
MFGFRSHDDHPTAQSLGYLEQLDAKAALRCAHETAPPGSRLGLVGASMGGAVSLMVGHDPPPAPKVVGIATDCAFANLRDVVVYNLSARDALLPKPLAEAVVGAADLANQFWYGYPFAEVDPAAVLRQAPPAQRVPLLIMHAQNDKTVPVAHAHVLYSAAATDKKQLVVIPHAAHVGCFFADRLAYLRRLTTFMDRAFADAEGAPAAAREPGGAHLVLDDAAVSEPCAQAPGVVGQLSDPVESTVPAPKPAMPAGPLTMLTMPSQRAAGPAEPASVQPPAEPSVRPSVESWAESADRGAVGLTERLTVLGHEARKAWGSKGE